MQIESMAEGLSFELAPTSNNALLAIDRVLAE